MRTGEDIPPTQVIIDDAIVARVDARPPDLWLVDRLLRMQLAARRRGQTVSLRAVQEELRGLLELVGLADVFGLEPRRQPELGEQRGVEEVVEPRDPLP